MFDYLQQFNSLSKDLRDRISSPSVMAAVTELEGKYKVDLAMTVMKVMIKSLTVKDLPSFFISDANLSQVTAESLARELKEKVFSVVADHLGLTAEIRALDLDRDIAALIREAGLSLASDNLVSRLKNILATYLRGVRSKIDTRNSLAKDVKVGGLNLSPTEIDRVLKICDSGKLQSAAQASPAPQSKPAAFTLPPEEYDLKRALSSGQVKPVVKTESDHKPESSRQTEPGRKIEPSYPAGSPAKGQKMSSDKLDTAHEISAPKDQLDLAAPIPPLELKAPTRTQAFETAKTPDAPKAPETAKVSDASKASETAKVLETAKAPVISKTTPVAPVPSATQIAQINQALAPSKSPVLSPSPKVAAQTAQPLKPNIVQRPAAIRRPVVAPTAAKPRMHDIKPVPKVMGPIEELQFLDPVNFRRLGKTPAETTAKIFAKIKLLEKDGYDKMVAGVRAWRQSPVNRLYLRLGQEAIAKGITLKDAVAARQGASQEYLSLEEVEAVLNLNSKLVF